MTEIPFDTMAAVRRLRESGMSQEQAEAVTQTVRESVTGSVITKADLIEIRANIAELKIELKWIKLIYGAILVMLVLTWLAKIIATTMPGG